MGTMIIQPGDLRFCTVFPVVELTEQVFYNFKFLTKQKMHGYCENMFFWFLLKIAFFECLPFAIETNTIFSVPSGPDQQTHFKQYRVLHIQ